MQIEKYSLRLSINCLERAKYYSYNLIKNKRQAYL